MKWLCLVWISLMMIAPIYASNVIKNYTDEEKELILQLYDIGILRFNAESMNCPLSSPYYVDLRHIISYPQIFKKIIARMAAQAQNLSFDVICGVPYAALAMASGVAYEVEKPLIMRRSYIKEYGTGKRIEGVFTAGMNCLVFEDVVTTASSLIETIKDLERENLKVKNCIILFDRQQGGVEWMKEHGYEISVMFTISDFMNVLAESGKIDAQFARFIVDWTSQHQVGGLNWKASL